MKKPAMESFSDKVEAMEFGNIENLAARLMWADNYSEEYKAHLLREAIKEQIRLAVTKRK